MSNSTTFGNTTSHYLAAAISVQNEMAKKVISENTLKKEIIYICGVDVAYRNNIAYCSAVLMNKNSMEVKESVDITLNVKNPYVSSFFMLRESEAIINILKLLKNGFDLLLIDGHGVHPRRCGLASYVGVIIDRFSGFKMVKEKKKPIFISVGHKINLINAIRIVKQLVKPKERIPEPLRLADIYSKALANSVP
jgi:deoxyribonuclease V